MSAETVALIIIAVFVASTVFGIFVGAVFGSGSHREAGDLTDDVQQRADRYAATTAQEQEARHQFAEPCPVHHLEVARAKALHPTSLPRKEGA